MPRSNLQIVGKLIGLVKPLTGFMLLAILLGVLGFLAAIFIPVLGVYALVGLAGYELGMSLTALFVTIAACALCRGFLRYGEQLCNHYIAFKLLALIRDQVFQALRRLSPAKMETKDKGNLITVLTSDIELLEVFYAHTISPVVIASITSLVMLGFFALINPFFALIAALAYLCVGVLIPVLTSKAGREAGASYRERSGQLSSYLLDSLRGLREIMQYNQGDLRLGGIREQTLGLGKKQNELKGVEGFWGAVTGAAIMLFSLALLIVGAVLLQSGLIDLGGLVLAFVAMISSFGPVLALSNLANNLVYTFASGNRVLDILEEEPETLDVTEGVSVDFENLACNQVSFRYAQEPILENFDLTIEKGQTVGIVGKSGSGKSTLLRLIMRFWDVDKGRIEISDADVRGITTNSLRDIESFVAQDTQLFDDTIENNIKIGKLDATHDEVVRAAKKASLHEFILTLPRGYESSVGELGDMLSGGEKQRIGLARAFLHDAPLMLLDEPTSNLDSLNEGVVLKSLKTEAENKTVIVVSHRVSTMAFADEIISMKSSRAS
ncbi:MAG: amino acid ABC transporter ATP-binding/permease protein [Raoultibacter sp.]